MQDQFTGSVPSSITCGMIWPDCVPDEIIVGPQDTHPQPAEDPGITCGLSADVDLVSNADHAVDDIESSPPPPSSACPCSYDRASPVQQPCQPAAPPVQPSNSSRRLSFLMSPSAAASLSFLSSTSGVLARPCSAGASPCAHSLDFMQKLRAASIGCLTMADKRGLAVMELIESERTYIDHLKLIVSVFVDPIRQRKILTEDQINAVFCGVETLLPINVELLRSFLKVADYLKMYSNYCSNVDNQTETVVKLRKCNPQFDAFVQEIIRNTEPDDPANKELTQAHEKVNAVCLVVNQKKKDDESCFKLLDLQERLVAKNGKPLQLFDVAKKLLLHGNLQERMLGNTSSSPQAVACFLFNDSFIRAHRYKFSYKKMAVETDTPIALVNITDIPEGEHSKLGITAKQNASILSLGSGGEESDTHLLLFFDTEKDKSTWMYEIMAAKSVDQDKNTMTRTQMNEDLEELVAYLQRYKGRRHSKFCVKAKMLARDIENAIPEMRKRLSKKKSIAEVVLKLHLTYVAVKVHALSNLKAVTFKEKAAEKMNATFLDEFEDDEGREFWIANFMTKEDVPRQLFLARIGTFMLVHGMGEIPDAGRDMLSNAASTVLVSLAGSREYAVWLREHGEEIAPLLRVVTTFRRETDGGDRAADRVIRYTRTIVPDAQVPVLVFSSKAEHELAKRLEDPRRDVAVGHDMDALNLFLQSHPEIPE
eukprot:m51a1_g9168 hypothetical protein (708) ;mRNA; r:19046-22528